MTFPYHLTSPAPDELASIHNQKAEIIKLLTDDELLSVSGAPDVNNDPDPQ